VYKALAYKHVLIEEILGGKKVFGNKDVYPTNYGLVVGPRSYTAIHLDK
ncbi:MAG: hypothetical protein HXL17_06320, partial [Peptostreptococcus sp.]|nr:hypothetical protein [Peptostreptococcus sp.]